VRGHPVAAVFIVLAIGLLCAMVLRGGKVLRDGYFPYEGRVHRITTSWLDWLVFDFSDYEHLVIQTPTGKTIDRIVSMEIRSRQRIEKGDDVVKGRGLRNWVRPRDKQTTDEMRDAALKALHGSP
jgi:hypothetical protein